MSPLQALILDRMRQLGLSPRQVEDRGVTHATLHRYMNPVKLKSPPRQQVLESLARALDLPIGDVQRAAVQSVSYLFKEPDHAAIAPRDDSAAGSDDPVRAAIEADTRLVPEARDHLLRQHALLLRIQPNPEVEAIHEEARAEMAEERHLRSAPKGPSRDVRPRA